MSFVNKSKTVSLTSPPFFCVYYFNLSLSFNPDRPTILHIFAIYKKLGTVSGDSPQGRNLRRHIAISKNKSLLSFISDRFSILRIFATYKKGGTVSGDSPQGRNLKRHIAISKNKIFTIVHSRPFHYPAYICNL